MCPQKGGGCKIQQTPLYPLMKRAVKTVDVFDSPLDITPSEQRLQRLRYIYGALVQNEQHSYDHQQQHFQQLRRAAIATETSSACRKASNRHAAAGLGAGHQRPMTRTPIPYQQNPTTNQTFSMMSHAAPMATAESPLNRMRAARYLGNEYSRMNLMAPTTSPPPLPRAEFVRASHIANIQKSRIFGNEVSRRNTTALSLGTCPTMGDSATDMHRLQSAVRAQLELKRSQLFSPQKTIQGGQALQTMTSSTVSGTIDPNNATRSSASVGSTISTCAQHEYGRYCRLRNRLVLLEQCRIQMMQVYGKDEFLDEYTELLEQCWRYEAEHRSVEQFATDKIVEVLADLERMKRKMAKRPKVELKATAPVVSAAINSGKEQKQQVFIDKYVRKQRIANKTQRLPTPNAVNILSNTPKSLASKVPTAGVCKTSTTTPRKIKSPTIFNQPSSVAPKASIVDKYLSNFDVNNKNESSAAPQTASCQRHNSPPPTPSITTEKSRFFACSDTPLMSTTTIQSFLGDEKPTLQDNEKKKQSKGESIINVQCKLRSEQNESAKNTTVQMPVTTVSSDRVETDVIVPPAELAPIELPQFSAAEQQCNTMLDTDSVSKQQLVKSIHMTTRDTGNISGCASGLASAVRKNPQNVSVITDHILEDIVTKCLMAVLSNQLQQPIAQGNATSPISPTSATLNCTATAILPKAEAQSSVLDSNISFHSMTPQELADQCNVLKTAVQRVLGIENLN